MKQQMAVQVSSEEQTWVTPPDIITLVTRVLGKIELEPASSETANQFVKAERIYTEKDDALSKSWDCHTFFLNPPFGKVANKSQAGIFADMAVNEFNIGNITGGGIILLHSRFGYEWFSQLIETLPSCTLRERISFLHPETLKPVGKSKTSQTLFLVGNTFLPEFVRVFNTNGMINVPWMNKI